MADSTPATETTPTVKALKTVSGKNYTFSFGPYRNRKVYEILAVDPAWLVNNDKVCFNLAARLYDEAKALLPAASTSQL